MPSPLAGLEPHLNALYAGMAATAGLALLLGASVCYWLVRRHTAPLVELTRFADDLARGDLERRTQVAADGEAGTLSRALNSMATALARLVHDEREEREELKTVLSAMAEGVIATDAGGNRELLTDTNGETGGAIVPIGEPARLADAILALARDPAERARRGAIARRRAHAFSLDETWRRYAALYAPTGASIKEPRNGERSGGDA